MPDDLDRIQERVLQHTAASEASVRGRPPELIAVGFCHYCGETVRPGHLFCDPDCRDDWQREQDRKKRNGAV